MILIYVTHPNEQVAEEITKALLDQKLIACAAQVPTETSYWWQGTITHDNEVITLFKSRQALYPQIESLISQLHPYDVPCIMTINAQANTAYEQWIEHETKHS